MPGATKPLSANNLTWGQLIDNSAGQSSQIHCMMRAGHPDENLWATKLAWKQCLSSTTEQS